MIKFIWGEPKDCLVQIRAFHGSLLDKEGNRVSDRIAYHAVLRRYGLLIGRTLFVGAYVFGRRRDENVASHWSNWRDLDD